MHKTYLWIEVKGRVGKRKLHPQARTGLTARESKSEIADRTARTEQCGGNDRWREGHWISEGVKFKKAGQKKIAHMTAWQQGEYHKCVMKGPKNCSQGSRRTGKLIPQNTEDCWLGGRDETEQLVAKRLAHFYICSNELWDLWAESDIPRDTSLSLWCIMGILILWN